MKYKHDTNTIDSNFKKYKVFGNSYFKPETNL